MQPTQTPAPLSSSSSPSLPSTSSWPGSASGTGASQPAAGSATSVVGIVSAVLVLAICLCSAAAVVAAKRRSDRVREWHSLLAQAQLSRTRHQLVRLMRRAAEAEADDDDGFGLGRVSEIRRRAEAAIAASSSPLPATDSLSPELSSGCSLDEVDGLLSHLYRQSTGSEAAETASHCVVCLSDFELGVSRLTTLQCGHSYHTDCIARWLQLHALCPLCLRPCRIKRDAAAGVAAGREDGEAAAIELTAIVLQHSQASAADADVLS